MKSFVVSAFRNLKFFLVFLMLFGFSVSKLNANTISEIVAFGDSLTDIGNVFTSQLQMGNPGLPPSPPYDNGRFSNGTIWVERLASGLGLPPLTPSLLGGTNHAWGGANTGPGTSVSGIPNIGEQINLFLISGNVPAANQLFVVWGGANDIINAVTVPDPAVIARNIADHIATIVNAAPTGTALNFLVPNLPPLGNTPRALWQGQNVDPNIPATLNALSTAFNTFLPDALEDVEESLNGVIYQPDTFSLNQAILMDPAAFGFTNVTDTARLGSNLLGGPPDFFSPGTDVVSNPDEYLFFDDIHPTRALHEIFGEEALALVGASAVPEPSTMLLIATGFIGLIGLGRKKI
jgi:3-phytase